jgi:hypothetical protein
MSQAGNQSTQAVNTALEAACCCMQVLSAASMHNSLYIDELMTAVVSLAKYHLQYNVLALHDPQYKRLYRPAAAAAQGEAEGKAWFWVSLHPSLPVQQTADTVGCVVSRCRTSRP